MQLLTSASLPRLPRAVRRPGFDPAALKTGIVHLGCGAFHRAHQAVYTQAVLDRKQGAWGIVGVSLQGAGVRDKLKPQDGLYTVIERSGAGETCTVIGTLRDVLFAPEDPGAVMARIADPAIKIVSITVTEKGYCRDPALGRLDAVHPDISHDLARPDHPRSMLGVLVGGLARRQASGAGPVTVLCCDNLPHNGKTVATLVASFAALRDDRLAAWIAANVAFPSTMVDRIVPATSEADLATAAAALGLRDEAPVAAEPFKQWVIEDNFAAGRPEWEVAGAELVSDVTPFEEMKLRLLNGSHSAIAYLGYLAGHEFVYQVMQQPDFVRVVRGLMAEAAPTLRMPAGVDVAGYQAALLERFANPAIKHKTWQIAMDGSQKLPQRLLGSVRDNLAAGRPVKHLALAVAAWMRYAGGVDEKGQPIDVRDPLAARFKAVAGSDASTRAKAFFALREIFGEDLPKATAFTDAVATSLDQLTKRGAAATAASFQ
jgi:fructuronate reductase